MYFLQIIVPNVSPPTFAARTNHFHFPSLFSESAFEEKNSKSLHNSSSTDLSFVSQGAQKFLKFTACERVSRRFVAEDRTLCPLMPRMKQTGISHSETKDFYQFQPILLLKSRATDCLVDRRYIERVPNP